MDELLSRLLQAHMEAGEVDDEEAQALATLCQRLHRRLRERFDPALMAQAVALVLMWDEWEA